MSHPSRPVRRAAFQLSFLDPDTAIRRAVQAASDRRERQLAAAYLADARHRLPREADRRRTEREILDPGWMAPP